MKTKEELTVLREEFAALREKLAELTEEELTQVTGGESPFDTPKHTPDYEIHIY